MESLKSAILSISCVVTKDGGGFLFRNGIVQNLVEWMPFLFARLGIGRFVALRLCFFQMGSTDY